MKRLVLLLLLLAAPAGAAERHLDLQDFDRIRVEGPFEVHLATRGVPGGRVAGLPAAADSVEVRIEGRTLVVRPATSDGTGGGRPHDAPIVYLRTTDLRGAGVVAGGRLEITGPVRAERVDLQVTGSGTIAAATLDAEQLVATLIGTGTLTLGGRAAHARLLVNGAGALDAAPLQTDDVVVRLDGTGSIRTSARYVANVMTSGVGTVTVYGKPKCTVKAVSDGPVVCGATLVGAK